MWMFVWGLEKVIYDTLTSAFIKVIVKLVCIVVVEVIGDSNYM